MKLHELMFPMLNGKWEEANFNELAKQHVLPGEDNPLLDAEMQATFVNAYHVSRGVDYTYGGWMEDRSTLWKGHYHDPSRMIHLGIDYNVPEGTEVCMPFDGEAKFVIHDPDQDGGWGGRIDFYNEKEGFYFIVAHLRPMVSYGRRPHTWFPVSAKLKQSETFGFIGSSYENGGWFPHLHLQIVSKEEYERHANPMDIDGYGGEGLEKLYPNPEDRVKNPIEGS